MSQSTDSSYLDLWTSARLLYTQDPSRTTSAISLEFQDPIFCGLGYTDVDDVLAVVVASSFRVLARGLDQLCCIFVHAKVEHGAECVRKHRKARTEKWDGKLR